MITTEKKAEIIKEYQTQEGSTGCYPDLQNQRSERTPESS